MEYKKIRKRCIVCGHPTANTFTNVAYGFDVPCCAKCKPVIAFNIEKYMNEMLEAVK